MALRKSLGRKWNILRKSWVFQVSAAVLLGLSLLAVILWNQRRPQQAPSVPAFTIGDETVSAVTMNYYFRDAYDSVLGALGEISADVQLLDPSVPLDQQPYSDAGTWADFLFEAALSNAAHTEAICAEARAQGYAFDERAAAKEQLDALRQRSTEQGFPSLTAFLRSFYGPAAGEDSYGEYLRHTALADTIPTASMTNPMTRPLGTPGLRSASRASPWSWLPPPGTPSTTPLDRYFRGTFLPAAEIESCEKEIWK